MKIGRRDSREGKQARQVRRTVYLQVPYTEWSTEYGVQVRSCGVWVQLEVGEGKAKYPAPDGGSSRDPPT
jgi:hypothetical protein